MGGWGARRGGPPATAGLGPGCPGVVWQVRRGGWMGGERESGRDRLETAARTPASRFKMEANPGASGGSKTLARSPSAVTAPGTPDSGAAMVELEGKSLYEALGVARDASQVLISAAQPLVSLSQQPRSPRLLNPQSRPTSARPTSSWPWPCTPTRTPTTPRPRSGSRRCRRSTASCPTQTSAGRRAGGTAGTWPMLDMWSVALPTGLPVALCWSHASHPSSSLTPPPNPATTPRQAQGVRPDRVGGGLGGAGRGEVQ